MFNFYRKRDLLKKQNNKEFYKGNDLDIQEDVLLLNKEKINNLDSKNLKNFDDSIENVAFNIINNADSNFVIVIRSSLRGFHISISTGYGRVLKVFSSGLLGYKKAQRYNQESLISLSREVLEFFRPLSKQSYSVSIVLKGFNSRRKRLIKIFMNSFLKKRFISLIDISDLPYNGCRPKKIRRK